MFTAAAILFISDRFTKLFFEGNYTTDGYIMWHICALKREGFYCKMLARIDGR
jgi:hypothetical protein